MDYRLTVESYDLEGYVLVVRDVSAEQAALLDRLVDASQRAGANSAAPRLHSKSVQGYTTIVEA